MFDDVDKNNQDQDQDQKQQADQSEGSSPASAEVRQQKERSDEQQQAQQQENEAKKSAGTAPPLARGRAVPGEKNQPASGQGGDADNQVEDIFAGIDEGNPPKRRTEAQETSDNIQASSSSIFNRATVLFVIIVAVLAGVILSASYWVSEWMTSSLGV